jgi:hypothetical protein
MHSETPIVDAVIRSRKAVRVFLSDTVSRGAIVDILMSHAARPAIRTRSRGTFMC